MCQLKRGSKWIGIQRPKICLKYETKTIWIQRVGVFTQDRALKGAIQKVSSLPRGGGRGPAKKRTKTNGGRGQVDLCTFAFTYDRSNICN